MKGKKSGSSALVLSRLAEAEQRYIQAQFDFYDYNKTGLIERHLAQKILQNIGVEPSVIALPIKIDFQALCTFIDSKLPDPDPPLECSLHTFTRMIGEIEDDSGGQRVIRPQALIHFMKSLDRPAPTLSEADMLLTSMLDYDYVDKDTKVSDKLFGRELMSFAKKSNAFREFR